MDNDGKLNIDDEPALTLEVYTVDEIKLALDGVCAGYDDVYFVATTDWPELLERLRRNKKDLLDKQEA